MAPRLAHLALARVLSWLALLAGSDAATEVEILVPVGAESPVTASGDHIRGARRGARGDLLPGTGA